MKTSRFSIAAVCVAVVVAGQPGGLQAQSAASTAISEPVKKETQSLKVTTPVEEVVQLSKSGVGDALIVSYIQNSERPYRLNAQDIIKLRDEGVSTEVTTALIQRGAEQRQAVEAAQQKQTEAAATESTVAAAPTYQTQPAQVQVVETAPQVTYYTPVQPVSTVSVTYFGSRPYSYRSVYAPSYRYYAPSYYYAPRVSFGVGYHGGYRHGGFRSSARYCR